MRGIHAFLFITLLTIIVVLVPYLIIGGIPKFSASYLYWTIIPILVVLWAVWYTRRWFSSEKGGKK
jgi:hypothetical protein